MSDEEFDAVLDGMVGDAMKREATRRPQSRFAAGALQQQVGGDHYLELAIGPIQLAIENRLNACQYSAIKYIMRKKGSRLEDIDKAIHVLHIYRELIEKGLAE